MAEQNQLDRDGWFRIEVTPDFMEAYLIMEPPVGTGNWPGKDKAKEALRNENVVYGINDDQIDESIAKHIPKVLVAKGTPPEPGRDAEINFLFEIGAFRKAMSEDNQGRVDFRQVQTVQSIKQNQVIAVKTPATSGVDGYDVQGHKLSATPGKDKQIKLGKNVSWSADNLSIIAGVSGEPSFANNRLSIFAVHELKGDVNFESGNIIFPGSINIHGNVESGFRVEAEGDVNIFGNVDSAEIKAGGHLFIQGGVSGMDKSVISCGGDLTAKYIERAKVSVGGTLTVREAIMHCQINAEQKIVVEGKGLIVGGVIRAGLEIAAKTIGSRLGTITELEVGVRPQIKLEIQEHENELKNDAASLDKAEKAIAILSNTPNLPPDRQAMLQTLIKTSYALKARVAENEARLYQLMEENVDKSKERGRIKVSDTIFPGVRVTIGKSIMVIPDEFKYAIIYYNAGEIQLQSMR